LQRLPGMTIKRPQIGGKIIFKEDPGAADFRARNPSRFSTPAKLFRVQLEKQGGLKQPECAH
jgi:hypothetical protein